MRNGTFALMLSACLLGGAAMVGCDRELASETTVKESGDKTTVKDEKVVEKPDGTIEKTTEKKTVDADK